MKQGNDVRKVYYKGRLKLILHRQNGVLHRKDGPAYIRYSNGRIETEMYLIEGVRHRTDGPAVIRYGPGGQIIHAENWLNGEPYGSTADMTRRAV